MAFIGVVVGAGFASGQEAMQYFVAFGNWGLWGIALAAGLMMITGISILQLGSYFQAEEHTAVYDKVASPFTAKILDWSTLVTLFAIGFVMFAGGGSNINQQFPSIPVWVGATAMLILVLIVGLMDVDRVTAVIGTITPFIIIFVVIATGYTILNADVDFSAMNDWAVNNVDTSLPNWWLAALNYTGLNVMTAVSMSIVIGGNFLDNRAVGIGGLIGGLLYLILLALLVFALFFEAKDVNGQDLPVLSLISGIHPVLGVLMTFVIYGMVFNTAIGMFYALGKRLTRNNPKHFYPVYAGACIIGFILSFVGFHKRVRKEGSLPAIDPVVDIYNAISIRYAVPVGGENLAAYRGEPRLAIARGDEPFDTLKSAEPVVEYPEPGEVIWRDDIGVTCRRWNWRQGVRTRLDSGAQTMWFILESLPAMPLSALQEAGERLVGYLQQLMPGARASITLLQADDEGDLR